MGVGKTVEGIATIEALALETEKKHAAGLLPEDHVFKPSLWVTLKELDSQTLSDFVMAFKGRFEFHVMTSVSKKSFPPEVQVHTTNAQWTDLSERLYRERNSVKVFIAQAVLISIGINRSANLLFPQTCRVVIVTSYAVAGMRWLHAKTSFESEGGERSRASLARRQKTSHVNIHWGDTMEKLGKSFSKRVTPLKVNQALNLPRAVYDDSSHEEEEDEDDAELVDKFDEEDEESIRQNQSGQGGDHERPIVVPDDGDSDDGINFDDEGNPFTPQQVDGADEVEPDLSGHWTEHKALQYINAQMTPSYRKYRGIRFSRIGPESDRRAFVVDCQTKTRMLRQFFASRKITRGNDMIRFFKKSRSELPVTCWTTWKMGDNFFNRKLAQTGETLSFGLIAYDEVQNVRNPTSTQHFLAKLIPGDRFLGLTGTPIFNKTSDCGAYMSLFASRCRIDDFLFLQEEVPQIINYVEKSEDVVSKRFVGLRVSFLSSFFFGKGQGDLVPIEITGSRYFNWNNRFRLFQLGLRGLVVSVGTGTLPYLNWNKQSS